MSLADKVAVITGASRGIGKGLAGIFEREGLKLGLCARTMTSDSSEHQVRRGLDVRDPEAMDEFVDAVTSNLGPIDLWINNAGVLAPIAPLRDVESREFAEHLEINVLGVFHGSRAYVRHVRSHTHKGVLVNISSGAARHAYSGWSAYCAGKAAVDRMSECIAMEESDTGLRVHAVAPGVIDTDMQALIRGTSASDFPSVDRFIEMKEEDTFSSMNFVGARMLELAFGSTPPEEVLISFPLEK